VTVRTGFCNKMGSIVWRHKCTLHYLAA
jgi:hypothetical protein